MSIGLGYFDWQRLIKERSEAAGIDRGQERCADLPGMTEPLPTI